MADRGGIFCIEDDWRRDESPDELPAKPMLEALEKWDHKFEYEHRNARNRDDLLKHVNEWAVAGWEYSILYFWSHGSPNAISLGGDEVKLEEIGEILDGQCDGKGLIHFGSCSTLRLTDDCFLEKTGAAAVSGYRVEVGWIEPLAFEMLYFRSVSEEMSGNQGLTPGVMKRVWERLNERQSFVLSLMDFLHFDLRIAARK